MVTASVAPMNIVYVGNFNWHWCTEVHVAASLEYLGHHVRRVQEDRCDWRKLPGLVADERASVLLWTRTWDVPPAADEALEALRRMGVPTVSYHLDRWWGLEREYQVAELAFFRTDLVVSPDDQPERWAAAGVNHMWLPPGVFHAECEHVAPLVRRWPYRVAFVGSHPYPHPAWEPVRTELIETFEEEFGSDFAVVPGADARRPVRGVGLAQLYATVPVILGDSCLAGDPVHYWSDRIPETLGRGGALLHPRVPGMVDDNGAWYEHGAHLMVYDSPEEAVALAHELLAHPDRAADMTYTGRGLVLDRDTYAHRLDAVLARVQDQFALPRPPRAAPSLPAPVERPGVVTVRFAGDRRARVTGSFELAEGDTDRIAVDEVWQANDYRVSADQLRGKHVVDIGANCGAFTVLAAKLGAAHVTAYEPHPETAEVLLRNVKANGVEGRVTVVQAAVLTLAGEVYLYGDGGGASIVAPPAPDGRTVAASATAASVTFEMATAGADFVKVDCEGAEYTFLPVADLSHIERMALEFHGPAMPHLALLTETNQHEAWGAMVTNLATYGRLEIVGRPSHGGLMYWSRYG